MKSELSSLELYFLLKEFKLDGAKIEQVYQHGIDEIVFQLHVPKKGKIHLRILMGKVMYLASAKPAAPEKPPGFCLFLRRRLKNARIRNIEQVGFERVIDFLLETKDNKFHLIIELFSKGNIILTDENHIILSSLYAQEWKDRAVKPKSPYIPPSKDFNILDIQEKDFKNAILNSTKDSLVKSLAIDFSLGGLFSEEICTLTKIDKNIKPNSLSESEIASIFEKIQELISREASPIIVHDDNSAEILPFPLNISKDKVSQPFDSFNLAIDSILTEKVADAQVQTAKKESKTRVDKVNEIVSQQNLRIEGLKKSEKENQRKGEIIYEHYSELNELLEEIKLLRKTKSWDEVKQLMKTNKLVKSIDSATGKINLVL